MDKIKGEDIVAETDMYGYPIDPNGEYVVDHINGLNQPEYVTVEAWDNSHRAPRYTLIDQDSFDGIYDFTVDEMIVEAQGGQRVYLVEGYGGEQSVIGGAYRWIHGLAIYIKPEDTLKSLHEDIEDFERMMHGYDEERPVQTWDGKAVEQCARGVIAREAARVLGSLGGLVTGDAKSKAAKARNAKRKAEGKPEGGRPRKPAAN